MRAGELADLVDLLDLVDFLDLIACKAMEDVSTVWLLISKERITREKENPERCKMKEGMEERSF
jgi:hypothetical protein